MAIQPTIICFGKKISNLDELRESFDIRKVCAYVRSGRLCQWLDATGNIAQIDEINGLDKALNDDLFAEDLMVVLGLSEEQMRNALAHFESYQIPQVQPTTVVEDQPLRKNVDISEKDDIPENQQVKTPSDDGVIPMLDGIKLTPIQRKILKIKDQVMEIIQNALVNECLPEEIHWDTNFEHEIGCDYDLVLEIDRTCKKTFGVYDLCSNIGSSPFQIFLIVVKAKYPSRYPCDILFSGDYEPGWLGDDAEALGFFNNLH